MVDELMGKVLGGSVMKSIVVILGVVFLALPVEAKACDYGGGGVSQSFFGQSYSSSSFAPSYGGGCGLGLAPGYGRSFAPGYGRGFLVPRERFFYPSSSGFAPRPFAFRQPLVGRGLIGGPLFVPSRPLFQFNFNRR